MNHGVVVLKYSWAIRKEKKNPWCDNLVIQCVQPTRFYCWVKTWTSEARSYHCFQMFVQWPQGSHVLMVWKASLLPKCCEFKSHTSLALLKCPEVSGWRHLTQKLRFTSLRIASHRFRHFLSHPDTPSDLEPFFLISFTKKFCSLWSYSSLVQILWFLFKMCVKKKYSYFHC